MSDETDIKHLLTDNQQKILEGIKILMVGAGGIGCELLKNFMKLGVKNLTVIDLDTVDKTNLNRQFLFSDCDVDHPKATTAVKAVFRMAAEDSTLYDYVGIKSNIFEPFFNIDYVKQYHVVFNALDNAKARSHVNRLCLASKTLMINGGTTGLQGQAQVQFPHQFECQDCVARVQQKTYPVCTIRSTPDRPIHCIIWAKQLYDSIFGEEDSGNYLNDVKFDNYTMENVDEKIDKLFNFLYQSEPKSQNESDSVKKNADKTEGQSKSKVRNTISPEMADIDEETKIKIIEYKEQFQASLKQILQKSGGTKANFSKDDEDACQLVFAATNLRCFTYSMTFQTILETTRVAGNIVPAISTTNAMVAALQINLFLKALITNPGSIMKTQRKLDKANQSTVYLTDEVQSRSMNAEMLNFKNPKCFSCGQTKIELMFAPQIIKHRLLNENGNIAGQIEDIAEYINANTNPDTLEVKNFQKYEELKAHEMLRVWTLGDFVEKVAKEQQNLVQPTIYNLSSGDTMQECGPDIEEDEEMRELYLSNTLKPLYTFIEEDNEIVIEDILQEFKLTLIIRVSKENQFNWYENTDGAPQLVAKEDGTLDINFNKRKRDGAEDTLKPLGHTNNSQNDILD